MPDPIIVEAEIHEFEYEQKGLEVDEGGFNLVYRAGVSLVGKAFVVRLLTDAGITGEYVCRRRVEAMGVSEAWGYLKGKNALQRERIYNDLCRGFSMVAQAGIGPVDIALWDIAGKYHGVPVYKLLGGYKESFPCYASTYHGDHSGGLDSPQAYAEFAVRCKEMGYPAFKIHGWPDGSIGREIATIHAVRKAVGDELELMLDPACELKTFADALWVGRACDDARFYWYEDPFRDGGISQFAHRKLRQLISTPLLITEHVRTVEQRMDFAIAEATDFVRGDPDYNGITGTMKLAHACEALGLDVQIHDVSPAVRQCMAAIRNTNYYEMALVHPKEEVSALLPAELYVDYRDGLDVIDDKGHVSVPQGPGLGVQINWEFVKQHTTSVAVLSQDD